MKRSFDLIASIILVIILFPVMVLIAALVRWKLGGPVIFKQMRPGLYGKSFYLYKFRTMTDECDETGHLLPDQLRLNAFGKFIRLTSLDELPQLFNVIKGELSLIGPRPLLMEYLPLYTAEQFKRHKVRPGITGWAQVNGRNAISWEEKFELDIWYVENRSWYVDCKILFLTCKKVLRSEGISNANHATMPVFKGSISNHQGL